MALHEPTDDERYLAGPRWAPLLMTPLGWGLGGLLAGLALTLDGSLQAQALALHGDLFGPDVEAGDVIPVPVLNVTGVVVFAIGGFLAGLASSLITDLIDGVPKIDIGFFGQVLFLLLWIAALASQALVGLPVAAPIVGGLYGWVRARGFSSLSRKLQAGAWVAFAGLSALVLTGVMMLRPDLGMVALYP